MDVFVLNKENSIANQFLAELRDVNHQTDRMRFRKNLARLGQIMAYEFSKSLTYQPTEVQSPLGIAKTAAHTNDILLLTILRAGLPFYEGFLDYFDRADSGFVGAMRHEASTTQEITASATYTASPDTQNKTWVIIDPMLATGKSLLKSINNLLKYGEPRYIHIISVICAPEGIAHIKQNLTTPFQLWTVSIDEKLNEKSYIVPGLGDAGDLSFGQKI